MEEALAFWELTWERLRAKDRMTPDMPDWRQEWAPDRRYLVFLFEAGGVAEVVDAVRPIWARLEEAGIQPMRPDGLHLTIRSVGFVDELEDPPDVITTQAADALGEARATMVEVVGAGSFDDAAILQIAPFHGLREIQDRLLQRIAALAPRRQLAESPPAEGGFAPHISLAYYEEPVRAVDVARALEPFQRMRGPSFVVDAVALVSVPPPAEPSFTWEVVERFPLSRE